MSNTEKIHSLSQFTYEECKTRFSNEAVAKTYSTRHTFSRKGKREKACIKAALANVNKNALILDLPCGTGRISYFLKELGFRVLGADYSHHMIKQTMSSLNLTFEQQDIMAIKHPDHTFQAAVCNRLFHHYPAAETRRAALKELARVTDGPIIVSFFNSYSLSAGWSKFKNFLRNKKPIDRVAISFHVFKRDIESCGLKIVGTYFCRYGISPQTYIKVIKATSS
jgi:ubiquinone/menaquinone biosynthesis C-methylase UbiE